MLKKQISQEKSRSFRKKLFIIILLIIGVFFVIFFNQIRYGASFLYELLFNKNIILKRDDGNINMLFLGISGGQHAGPELSDTIIFASINIKSREINLFSIPRDLWIPELSAKINSAYAFGEEKKEGLTLASSVAEKVIGKSVDYVTVIDFSGFVKLIDHIGGIDVNVARSFEDLEYPIEGEEDNLCGHTEEELPLLATFSSQLEAFPCRYTRVSFQKGMQHMDGETALRFVRSRHAKGDEGTDIARSLRQQQLILSLRNKVLSLGVVLNPAKLFGIYDIIKANIHTNVMPSEYDDFVKLAQKMEKANIKSYIINYEDEEKKEYGLLTNPFPSEEYRFQWILIPRRGNGDFSEIHEYIACIEKGNECAVNEKGIEISQQ